MTNTTSKPLDCRIAGVKSVSTGTAVVSGWLKRKADANRADAFAESKSENPVKATQKQPS
jgi:hypothetical protein